MRKQTRGSSATELAVLIGILGLVAAVGYPRYAALKSETNKALVRSLGNNIQVSAQVAHLQWIIQDKPATIRMEDQTIGMLNGYPEEASIEAILLDFNGFEVIKAATTNFRKIDASVPGSCMVTYAQAAAGSSPIIDALTSGC